LFLKLKGIFGRKLLRLDESLVATLLSTAGMLFIFFSAAIIAAKSSSVQEWTQQCFIDILHPGTRKSLFNY
jgi:hypothetical protein